MKFDSNNSIRLGVEITPCKECVVEDICKYKSVMQIQYNKEIFEVSVKCKLKESMSSREGLNGQRV